MRLVPDPNPACVACGLPLAPAGMTPPPGYRRHPGCDPAGVELYCTGCQQGPAGCGCPVPRRWRPSPAAVDATAARLAEILGGDVISTVPVKPPASARRPGPKCPGCGHAAHPKGCRGKASSRCQPVDLGGGGAAMMCGYGPSCPCPHRDCRCGTPVLLAAELPPTARTLPAAGEVMVVSSSGPHAAAPAACWRSASWPTATWRAATW